MSQIALTLGSDQHFTSLQLTPAQKFVRVGAKEVLSSVSLESWQNITFKKCLAYWFMQHYNEGCPKTLLWGAVTPC